MNKRICILATWFLALPFFVACGYAVYLNGEEIITETSTNFEEAVVVRVIDGDTVVIEGGYHVRFIGIDAPEVGEPGAHESTEFVREKIYRQTVWLESSGANTDRFGRLRRYIWLQIPTDTQDEEQRSRYLLNTMLLENGLAVEMIIRGNP